MALARKNKISASDAVPDDFPLRLILLHDFVTIMGEV